MSNVLADALAQTYDEVLWDEFYGDIFADPVLAEEGTQNQGEYIGIATTIRTLREQRKFADGTVRKAVVRSWNHYVYDGLDKLDELINADHMDKKKRLTIISPISYAGNRRMAVNARRFYALCVEVDGLRVRKQGKSGYRQIGLENLYLQIEKEWLPRPTYIVASGNGLHLYYLFDAALPCYRNVLQSLARFKHDLTKRLWNEKVTDLYEEKNIQYESVVQGFRMVGTQTKRGDIVRAFRTGERVSIEYMNRWAYTPRNSRDKKPDSRIVSIKQSDLPLEKAQELYPEWFERRIVNGEGKRHWTCNRAVYDWWLERIKNEAVVGHRYYCLMCLSIYAAKCGISEEELTEDCYDLMVRFEELTIKKDNHFDAEDVEAALNIYRTNGFDLCTSPINYISGRSGLSIERNKRNGRKQSRHLEIIREDQALDDPEGNWRIGNGRKPKQDIVKEWRSKHPKGKKCDCVRDTGLSRPTVYKWWDDE